MGIALFIANTILVYLLWYFVGRSSVCRKIMEDYGKALTIIGKQEALIEAYRIKYNIKENDEENSK